MNIHPKLMKNKYEKFITATPTGTKLHSFAYLVSTALEETLLKKNTNPKTRDHLQHLQQFVEKVSEKISNRFTVDDWFVFNGMSDIFTCGDGSLPPIHTLKAMSDICELNLSEALGVHLLYCLYFLSFDPIRLSSNLVMIVCDIYTLEQWHHANIGQMRAIAEQLLNMSAYIDNYIGDCPKSDAEVRTDAEFLKMTGSISNEIKDFKKRLSKLDEIIKEIQRNLDGLHREIKLCITPCSHAISAIEAADKQVGQ